MCLPVRNGLVNEVKFLGLIPQKWFTRPFLLMRGWDLGTRLKGSTCVLLSKELKREGERMLKSLSVRLCKLHVLLHLLLQHRQSHHTIVSPLVLTKSFLASTACRLSLLLLLTLREKSFEYGSWLLLTNRKRSEVSESCSGPSPS